MRRELSYKELLENIEADLEESRKRICELKEEVIVKNQLTQII